MHGKNETKSMYMQPRDRRFYPIIVRFFQTPSRRLVPPSRALKGDAATDFRPADSQRI